MADYVIGDVQGCYEPLQRLLRHIHFDPQCDRLWFVGDLVNRGPESLQVLRFIHGLVNPPIVTLGNHDLWLLSVYYRAVSGVALNADIRALFDAPEVEILMTWLRQQPLMVYDRHWKVVVCHAGIAPSWDLATASTCAEEVHQVLMGPEYVTFLREMYGNLPDVWSADLRGMERWRIITNFFTRMRVCDADGRLCLQYKEALDHIPEGTYPWFLTPGRRPIDPDIIFGHWAALEGKTEVPGVYAIDTGCVWGGTLTALRLQDRQRFSVSGNI
ncbi:MAG: symmetrical bis(5'-nucleosyl)-tetraphosphatase [Legionellaceae bacterium]|nr:symmetrical bis(5'-nucleosyl)-tetraphosphatase [Legionellaceae bacterium]